MQKQRPGSSVLGPALFGGAAWMAIDHFGPVFSGYEINPFSGPATVVLASSSLQLLSVVFLQSANLFEKLQARIPIGLRGTSGWIKRRRELRHELDEKNWGPYWGTFKGRELIIPYASNALTLGPAGSGKDVGAVQSTILSIPHSQTVVDFKGTAACCLAGVLRKRGYAVRIINLGDLWTDILGPSDSYNPQCLIADDYFRPGGLRDVTDDIFELCLQLYPEPAESGGGQNDNGFFRNGSRDLMGFAIQMCVLVYGYEATLGHVEQMLNDKASLLKHAQWAAGRLEVENVDEHGEITTSATGMPLHESPWAMHQSAEDLSDYAEYFMALASGIADQLEASDSRTADSFLSGAQQSLSRFNRTTRASKKTAKTTFRFSDQKEGPVPTIVFLVADPSRMDAQAPVLGLIQWCMLQEWKRSPNRNRPVYLIANEGTNFKINGADTLMTWGREFGIHVHWIIQSLSAFRRVYGKEALNILLSETEIKQFLAGQREPETLKMIEELVGKQSLIVQGNRGNKGKGASTLDGFDLKEEGRALMDRDEVRRSGKAILIVRQNKPALVDMPPIAAIAPFRKQIDINPFFGKPYLLPVVLRIRRRHGGVLKRIFHALLKPFKRGA